MRELKVEELKDVSGGFGSFLDQSTFFAQNGDPTRSLGEVIVNGTRGGGGFGGNSFLFGFGGEGFTQAQFEGESEFQVADESDPFDETIEDLEEVIAEASIALKALETLVDSAKKAGETVVKIGGELVTVGDALKAIGEASNVLDRLAVVSDLSTGDIRGALETITDGVVATLAAAAIATGLVAAGVSAAAAAPIAAVGGIAIAAVVSVPAIVDFTIERVNDSVIEPAGNVFGQLEFDLRNSFLDRAGFGRR